MDHSPSTHPWLVALEHSAFGAYVRDAIWLYPAANVAHVLAIVLFFGLVAAMDLRLLGVGRAFPAGVVVAAIRPFAIAAFVVVFASGMVLFTAEATALVVNPVFQLKAALIGLGLLNVAALEGLWRRRDLTFAVPRLAQLAAGFSLLLWFVVIGLGRFIAYR